jgi:hypothetical protein
MVPQKASPAFPHVNRVQLALTHTPPVHVSPVGHLPQSSVCPQPSPTLPQNCVVPVEQAIALQLASPTQSPVWQDQPVIHAGQLS